MSTAIETPATARPNAPTNARTTVRVSGPFHPARVLTVDFDRLVEALGEVQEPIAREMEGLAAGSDLLLGILHGDLSFGAASPGAPPGADLAGRILALTDTALDFAPRILEQDAYNTLYFGDDNHRASSERLRQTLKLLDYRDDPDVYRDLATRLLAHAPVEDPAAARGLL